MPRMSKKRKQEWAFILSERNRITYNDLCRKCIHCRILEVCVPILFNGENFREGNAAENPKKAVQQLNVSENACHSINFGKEAMLFYGNGGILWQTKRRRR